MINMEPAKRNIVWNLSEDGVLTVSGTGPIPDYEQGKNDFVDHKAVKQIVVEPGITAIGGYAFQFFSNLEHVVIADTVTSIGESAFSFCSKLESIDIPDSIGRIENVAFDSCLRLNRVFIHGKNVAFGRWVFVGCPALTIYVEEGGSNTAVLYAMTNNIKYEVVSAGLVSAESQTSEIIRSGKCNEDISYTLDSSGTLRITGTGQLDDKCMIEVPWDIWNDEYYYSPWALPGPNGGSGILRVIIGEGITFFSLSLFKSTWCTWEGMGVSNEHPDLMEISLPSTLRNVSDFTSFRSGILVTVALENPFYPTVDGIVINEAGNIQPGLPSYLRIPNSSEIIYDSAYAGCEKLIWVDVTEGVRKIGSYAFGECKNLKKIYLPKSLISIDGSAFKYCSSLKEIEIPLQAKINSNIIDFMGCTSLEQINVAEGNPFYKSIDGVLFDFDCKTLIWFPSKRSGNYTIPDGVESISANAFYNCAELSEIFFPESLREIGSWAFAGCKGLSRIDLPDGIKAELNSFAHCENLKKINLPAHFSIKLDNLRVLYNLEEIEVSPKNEAYCSIDGVLYDKDREKLIFFPRNRGGTLRIPDGVKEIGQEAFFCCRRLAHIVFPTSLEKIGYWAFEHCSSLTELELPKGLQKIGSFSFSHCSGLKKLYFPESLSEIGDSAFFSCEGLTTLIIPSGVKEIGDGAFSNCRNLRDVIVKTTNCRWASGSWDRHVFPGCDALVSMTFYASDVISYEEKKELGNIVHILKE